MRHILHVPIQAFKELYNERYLTNASALAYTTLLSLIPLLSIFLYAASFSNYFVKFNALAKNYALDNLLPTSGSKLASYIDIISTQANQAPTKSFIFLLVTAILLIMSVDNTMKLIWQKKLAKKNTLHVLLYFCTILLIPAIIALASSIGAVIKAIMDYIPYIKLISFSVTLAVNGILLSLLYWATARRSVNFSDTLLGGIIAAILLEIFKYCFAFYITNLSNYLWCNCCIAHLLNLAIHPLDNGYIWRTNCKTFKAPGSAYYTNQVRITKHQIHV